MSIIVQYYYRSIKLEATLHVTGVNYNQTMHISRIECLLSGTSSTPPLSSIHLVFTGFLVQYLQGKPMEECIKCAHYTAKVILQVSGVTLVGTPDY